MSTNDDVTIEIGSFTARTSSDGRAVRLVMTGEADAAALAHFDDLFHRVHRKALDLGAKEVVVDIKTLMFMNASCIAKVVTWVNRVRDTEAASRYGIRFLSNQEFLWQHRSLHALRCFAVDLLTIDA